MTREELLEQVNGELGETQLTLSERTVNEELDDALQDMGEDTEANARAVKRIAARLKRMDGNLHADVAKEVKDWKADFEKKNKPAPKPKPGGNEPPADGESEAMKQMREEIAALKKANDERKAAETREAVLKEVRKRVEAKFAKAGMEVNGYFMRQALGRLKTDGEADAAALAEEAEKAYNADMKEAGVVPDQRPHYGGGGGGTENAASDFFARKAKKEGWGKKA